MPGTKVRCHYLDCEFLDESYCSAAAIELDPDAGCKTYSPTSEDLPEDDWDDEEVELEEWEEIEEDDTDEELWLDDNEEF